MKVFAVIFLFFSSTAFASNTWVVEAKDDITNKIETFKFTSPGVHPFKPKGFKKVTCDIVVGDITELHNEKLKSQIVSLVCRHDGFSFSVTHSCFVPPQNIIDRQKDGPIVFPMVKDGSVAKTITISCK